MEMDQQEDLVDKPLDDAFLLPIWQRLLLGLVGIAVFSGGVLAVFRTDNQAGSVALLAVGSGSLLLGLLGRFPEQGSWGGATYKYRRFAHRLKSSGTKERTRAAEEVLDEFGAAPSSRVEDQLVRVATTVMRESMNEDRIARLVSEMGLSVQAQPIYEYEGRAYRPHLLISPGPGGPLFPAFPVEVTGSLTTAAALIAGRFARAVGSRVGVVVASGPGGDLSPDSDFTAYSAKILMASAFGPDGDSVVRDVLNRVIQLTGEIADPH